MAKAQAAEAVLAGPPASVSGFVPFVHDGDEPVTVRDIVVADPDTDAELVVTIDPVTLAPGERRRLPLELRLPPQTPPGTWPLRLRFAGKELGATAHIVASHLVAVTPDAVVVGNRAGQEQTATVVVANEGNVDLQLPDLTSLPLYREDAAIATLRALAAGPASPVSAQLDPLPEPVDELTISLDAAGESVGPASARAVELTVVVPRALVPAHRYVAALPLSVATLVLTVVPAAGRR